jgi:hypothetical protein
VFTSHVKLAFDAHIHLSTVYSSASHSFGTLTPMAEYVEPDDFGEERARELYQYYRPPKHDGSDAVYLPYADTVLQAHCQLAACRLNVQRAMVCLVDKDTQFFVAEATKTLTLDDSTESEASDDGL